MMDMRIYRKDLALIRGRPLMTNTTTNGGGGVSSLVETDETSSNASGATGSGSAVGSSSGAGSAPMSPLSPPIVPPTPLLPQKVHETASMLRPPSARPRASDPPNAPNNPPSPQPSSIVPIASNISGSTTSSATSGASASSSVMNSPPNGFRPASRLEAGRRGSVVFGSTMTMMAPTAAPPSPADYGHVNALPPITPRNEPQATEMMTTNTNDPLGRPSSSRATTGGGITHSGNARGSGGGHYFVVPRDKIMEALTTAAHELLNWTKQGQRQVLSVPTSINAYVEHLIKQCDDTVTEIKEYYTLSISSLLFSIDPCMYCMYSCWCW
jgi:hypothetical protein